MNKLFKKKLWETLAFTFACILVVAIIVSDIAHAKAGLLNETFHLTTSKIVHAENEDPSEYQYFAQMKDASNIEEYYKAINIAVEDEGMVLLKNDNDALPLQPTERNVSLVLSGSASPFYATHGPGANPDIQKTNFKTAFTESGFIVNDTLYNYYTGEGATQRENSNGKSKTNEKGWSAYPTDVRNSIDATDIAVVVMTRISGEGSDVAYTKSDGYDGTYLSITNDERSVMSALAQKKAEGKIKKIIV